MIKDTGACTMNLAVRTPCHMHNSAGLGHDDLGSKDHEALKFLLGRLAKSHT